MRFTTTIEHLHQTLRADIRLRHLGVRLAYRSDLCRGRRAAYRLLLDIGPATNGGPPPEVTVEIAGRRHHEVLDPSPDPFVFEWDGEDASGVALGTAAPVTAVVVRGDGAPAGSLARRTALGRWDPRRLGLGGWTLSPVHHFDLALRALHTGAGRFRTGVPLRSEGELVLVREARGATFGLATIGDARCGRWPTTTRAA
jgi:hypothetical protein